MSNFSSQNFKVGPCTVIFKGEVLGETQDSSVIKINSKYHTFTNDQMTGIPIIRQLQEISIIFETELLAVDKGLDILLDSNKRITMDEINWMREPDYGELKLIPVNPLDTTGYRFPRALLLRNGAININSDNEHTLKVEFEAVYDENELMVEKIVVSDSDRINLTGSNSIEPAAFERAMTYYIAERLNLTVDTNIFRGNMPPNIDGCAVSLETQKDNNTNRDKHYEFSVLFIDEDRDKAMSNIHDLTNIFPVYGKNLNLDGCENLAVKLIYAKQSDFDSLLSDNGKIKSIGKLSLIAVI